MFGGGGGGEAFGKVGEDGKRKGFRGEGGSKPVCSSKQRGCFLLLFFFHQRGVLKWVWLTHICTILTV